MGKRIRVGYSNTSYSGSTNSTSSSGSSPSSSSSTGSTTPGGSGSITQPTCSSCNCDSKLSALETTVSLLQARLTSIENTAGNSNVTSNEEVIRVFPRSLNYNNPGQMVNASDEGRIIELFLFSTFPENEVINHLYLGSESSKTYIKGSKYEKYFTITGKRIRVDGNIIKESELNIIGPDWFLIVNSDTHLSRNLPIDQIVFRVTGMKEERVGSVSFEFDDTQNFVIKMTFPEEVLILNEQDDQFLDKKLGTVITFSLPRVDGQVIRYPDDNNLEPEANFVLLAQGATKRYKIVIYWTMSYRPEFT